MGDAYPCVPHDKKITKLKIVPYVPEGCGLVWVVGVDSSILYRVQINSHTHVIKLSDTTGPF